MGDDLKYVIVEEHGCESPIIFPALVDHSSFKGLHPVAAGFVSIDGMIGMPDVACWGESVSLGIGSRAGDAVLIKRELVRPHGWSLD